MCAGLPRGGFRVDGDLARSAQQSQPPISILPPSFNSPPSNLFLYPGLIASIHSR